MVMFQARPPSSLPMDGLHPEPDLPIYVNSHSHPAVFAGLQFFFLFKKLTARKRGTPEELPFCTDGENTVDFSFGPLEEEVTTLRNSWEKNKVHTGQLPLRFVFRF